MIFSFLKIIYHFFQLLICVLFIVEKMQPAFLPVIHHGHGFPTSRLLPKQFLLRPQPRPHALTWRRIIFLLR